MVIPALRQFVLPTRGAGLPAASRLWDFAGVAGAAALFLTIAVVSSRRPEYSHVLDSLSELGRGGRANAKLMNACGFVLSGVCTIIAARSVCRVFGAGAASVAGATLVVLAGAFLIGLGTFPMDERLPQPARELRTQAHVLCAFMVFACFVLAPLVLGLRAALRRPCLGFWAVGSLCTSLAVLGFGLPFFSADFEYRGASQRAAAAAHYVWLAAICAARSARGEQT